LNAVVLFDDFYFEVVGDGGKTCCDIAFDNTYITLVFKP
jgi:hypothetical protein